MMTYGGWEGIAPLILQYPLNRWLAGFHNWSSCYGKVCQSARIRTLDRHHEAWAIAPESYINIIFPPSPLSSTVSFPLVFLTDILHASHTCPLPLQALHITHLSTAYYMLCPCHHHPWYNRLSTIWWTVQIMNLVLKKRVHCYKNYFTSRQHPSLLPPTHLLGNKWPEQQLQQRNFKFSQLCFCCVKPEVLTAADTGDWPSQSVAAVNTSDTVYQTANMLHVTHNSTSLSKEPSAFTLNSTHWPS